MQLTPVDNSAESAKRWSAVLVMRDTDSEYDFMLKCLPSVFALCPSEFILALDAPGSTRVINRARELAQRYGYEHLRIVEVARSGEWNMQLANVVYKVYAEAANDYILCFDVDTVLTMNVLLGLEQVGEDRIACVSFTKNLLQKNLQDMIRNFFYKRYIKRAKFVFSGIYWIYRPYYYDLVKEEEFNKIFNGIDTFLVQKLLQQQKYQLVTRKEAGCNCLTYQSNDYPWRQFQEGVWHGANASRFKHPTLKALMVVATRQHPYYWKGYKWALKNQQSEAVRIASSTGLQEWTLSGSRYLPEMEWKFQGTGFVLAVPPVRYA